MIVTIKKDNNVKKVTKGAYDNLYKGMGFEIISDKKPREVKDAVISKESFNKKEKENEEK